MILSSFFVQCLYKSDEYVYDRAFQVGSIDCEGLEFGGSMFREFQVQRQLNRKGASHRTLKGSSAFRCHGLSDENLHPREFREL